MDFSQRVKELAARSKQASDMALTEEATKTSVVMPFIQVLGFDVFNLHEVVPEFVADVGIKKGEKIDFAVRIEGKTAILIEVKPITMSLGSAQFSQLFRYFATLQVRLAILTNGREVWFFSDIDEKNRMDKKPFFVFDLQSHTDAEIKNLAQFQKSNFNIDKIVESASTLKSASQVSDFLGGQLANPDDDFVRYVARQVYEGTITKAVVEQLKPVIPIAFENILKNRIQERLGITFKTDVPPTEPTPQGEQDRSANDDPVTTEDELHAFYIVRAIGARVAPVSRITMRDAKSYCSVFVDDKNNRPVCRFYFNAKGVRRIGIFDADKNEAKYDIEATSDIFSYASQLEAAILTYIK